MRTTKSFGIHFWLKRSKQRKDGHIPIYGRISVNGDRKDFSLRKSILENHWCSQTGRALPKTNISKTLNPLLDEVATRVKECYESFIKNKEFASALRVKMRYLGLESDISTLSDLIKYHRDEELKKLEPGTAKNYNATETYLMRFVLKKNKAQNIHLSQINYAFVVQFENYLRTCPSLRKGQPLHQNGIMKHMERFQKIIRIAVDFSWMENNPFAPYTLKYEEFDADFLDERELYIFDNLHVGKGSIEISKDIFIFSCYTGLCYVEVRQLRKVDIVIGIDGDDWINVRRQKSKTLVKVPLLDRAKEVLKKYKKYGETSENGFLLPTPSNVTLNRDVKILAKNAGIKKHLTFHVARHTFATTVTLLNDVPLVTVSKLLGHTKLSTTRRYARVIEKKISTDMMALKRKLESQAAQNKNRLTSSFIENKPHLKVVR